MTSLVIAEHGNGQLNEVTTRTVTAAAAVSSPVHVLVAGKDASAVTDAAAKLVGVERVLVADDTLYTRMMAETMRAAIGSATSSP